MKNCPVCSELLVFPRGGYPYCEDCGYPDEDFAEEYEYPDIGDRLEQYQPNLEFFDEKWGKWQRSGVITKTMKEDDRGYYRVKLSQE